MLRRSPLVYAGLSLAVLFGAYAVGCGSDEAVEENQPGRQPPPPPSGASSADGPGQAFAVSRLFLGGTDRNGTPNPTAWKDYGYNLDFKISTRDSTDVCKPAASGPPSVHDDGNEGIDNSFGKTLFPIISGLASDAENQINDALQEGSFTIIVNMENIGPEANYLNVLAKLYAGTGLVDNAVPLWDGNDQWLVAPELLSNPSDIGSSKVVFAESYVNDNTWVSGSEGRLSLAVNVQGFELVLNIERAIISMELDDARSGAANGIIAGILPAEQLISELRKVAGSFDDSLCGGTTFDSLADQLRQASDILADGSQDPNKVCDGISVGLGFSATAVQLGGIDTPAAPAADPCLCGDGNMDPGEGCDDGNKMNGDGCDDECNVEGGTGGGGTGGTGGAGGMGGMGGAGN